MGSPLRILHVVVNMNRGGAETLIMNLYRNIDRKKVQFDFLTCKKGVFDKEITMMGGRVYRIPYITEIGHREFSNEIRRFLTAHPIYKIIHSHLDKMSGLVLHVAKKAKVPIRIAHSHSTQSDGGVLSRAYKWYMGSKITSTATHLYACSDAAAQWLFRERSDQAFILKNGIEIDKFQFCMKSRKRLRSQWKLGDDTLVIGHVGRLSQEKNHLFLLEIFADIQKVVPQSLLILAGDGRLKVKIERKIRELNIDNKVKLLGVREDINQLLQAFDLFIFPSLYEGLPVTLIEAQGAGLPCLISNQITPEVDMEVGLVKYLPVTNRKVWVNCVIDLMDVNQSREISKDTLSLKGYDIKKIATAIQISYLSLSGVII